MPPDRSRGSLSGMSDDARKKELQEKVTQLVDRQFGGEWRLAFQHYAFFGSGDGVDKEGLSRLLEDAGIGNRFTRGAWTSGVLEKLDTNSDDSISWMEFQEALQAESRVGS